MKLLTILCIILQVLDGIFTGYGVTMLPQGLDMEGNILVKESMRALGVIPALLIIKLFGILIILKLYQINSSKHILSFICGIYTISAMLWIVTLFTAPH